MTILKGDRTIATMDDWFRIAPPKGGESQWKDCRSAKELARFWTMRSIEEASDPFLRLLLPTFGESQLKSAEPERNVRIDDLPGGHRNCDLAIKATSTESSIRIHVEAKADETFGELIGRYYDRKVGSSSKVPERIRGLVQHVFGTELTPALRKLRYQLLHASYATVLDAKSEGVGAAVFVVHEFRCASSNNVRVDANLQDWHRFLSALFGPSGERYPEDRLFGPVFVAEKPLQGAVPLYVGKITSFVH